MASSLHDLAKIAKQLTAYGLSIVVAGSGIRATNPLAGHLTHHILAHDGRYLMSCGYELGTWGDEAGTAQRLGYLLGVPLVRTACEEST